MEIYEGDIVKWGDMLQEVLYVNCAFVTKKIKNPSPNYLYDYTLSSLADVKLEVIGNIFDNKDLLE